ncbi:MAG: hypothetical protein Q8M94_22590 [Ignavibacteria bacterium]|nr:hypothetical protein [Ignavibacteria bacterium]
MPDYKTYDQYLTEYVGETWDDEEELAEGQMIEEILKYLPHEDKIEFLFELLDAVQRGDEAINKCLSGWEETAELNSIPGFRDRVWARFNELKKTGVGESLRGFKSSPLHQDKSA